MPEASIFDNIKEIVVVLSEMTPQQVMQIEQILCVAVALYILYRYLNSAPSNINVTSEQQGSIDVVASRLKHNLMADRILITRVENGSLTSEGAHILTTSCIYESVSPNVKKVKGSVKK